MLGLAACAVVAAAPVYTAGLMPGRYSVTPVGGTSPVGSVCVSDLDELYRAAHRSDGCRYFTAVRSGSAARVSYECADGSGLLTIRSVTPRTANVTASGVLARAPYKRQLIVRRTGECG